MRRLSARFQNGKFKALRRPSRSGVPASASRNGRLRPTSWLASRRSRPVSAPSRCASSIRRISGLPATRFAKASSSDSGAGVSGLRAIHREKTLFGSRPRRRERRWISRSNPVGPSKKDGANPITSTPAQSFTNSSSQTSNTVLPFPRGPYNTIPAGEGMPRRSSSRWRRNRDCSSSRPARYGGSPPGPGRNGP